MEKMTKEKALAGFGGGIDCSQAVLSHAAPKVGLDEEIGAKLGAAFGGGLWRGETCGCVAGAMMALGLKYGNSKPNQGEVKEKFLAKKAEFEEKFIAEHKTLICNELLNHDISKPGELEKIMEEGLFEKVCAGLVCSTCRILDEML
ncbi:MAG: C-GCAxxG-C-C family protein [Anaerovoracaceae bacterium]